MPSQVPPFPLADLRLSPTGIGSTHHRDPEAAASVVLEAYPDLPFWPQLPRRAPTEAMAPQAGLALPGARWDGRKLSSSGLDSEISLRAPLPPEDRAAGLYALLARLEALPPNQRPRHAKGQLIGPFTLGALIQSSADANPLEPRRLAILARFLGEQGASQARAFNQLGIRAIIVFDEPLLANLGDDSLPLTSDDASTVLRAAFAPVARDSGLPGLHSCAPIDWSCVLNARPAIIHFDATPTAIDHLLSHRETIRSHLACGGALGWGVWPTDDASPPYNATTARAALVDAADAIAQSPGQIADILRCSTLTGVCGTAGFSATREKRLAADLAVFSSELRERYDL